MKITNLQLKNYRNIKSVSIAPAPGINVLYGDNAQGKTNLLESIYVCATGRSHRTARDRDLICVDSDAAQIKMAVDRDGLISHVDMQIRAKGEGMKAAAIDGVPITRLGDLLGITNIVIFSPEDLSLIKAGPNLRRRFMDMELCQIYPNYYHNLRQYYRVLKQRNNLLKSLQRSGSQSDLDIWDEQLAEYGIKIMAYRRDFFIKIQNIAAQIHADITANKENLEIIYKKNIDENRFQERLTRGRDFDISRGTTAHGIHRDDAQVLINGRDAQKFASQGQQRTAALAMKLSEISLIYEETNHQPVLLLDDVLSELDSGRQRYLLSKIGGLQVFLTATGIGDLADVVDGDVLIYNVRDGELTV